MPRVLPLAGRARDRAGHAGRRATTTRSLGAGAALRGAATTATGLPSVAGAIRRSPQRVVVTNSMKAHVLVPPIARALRRRTGIRLHDVIDPQTTSATARRLLATSARLAVSTACVSGATAAAARAAGLPRVTSFPNGVDVDGPGPGPAPQPPLRLLAVSQLARWKGVHLVLEAGRGRGRAGHRAGARRAGRAALSATRPTPPAAGAERAAGHRAASALARPRDPAPLMRDAHPVRAPARFARPAADRAVRRSATACRWWRAPPAASPRSSTTAPAARSSRPATRRPRPPRLCGLAYPAAREPLVRGALLAAARARFSVEAYVRNYRPVDRGPVRARGGGRMSEQRRVPARAAEIPSAIVFARSDRDVARALADTLAVIEARGRLSPSAATAAR